MTRNCICGEHCSEVLPPTVGAAHDSSQTCFEIPEADEGSQSDVCEELSGSHRGLFRRRLGRRRLGQKIDLRKCVSARRRCDYLVQ